MMNGAGFFCLHYTKIFHHISLFQMVLLTTFSIYCSVHTEHHLCLDIGIGISDFANHTS